MAILDKIKARVADDDVHLGDDESEFDEDDASGGTDSEELE